MTADPVRLADRAGVSRAGACIRGGRVPKSMGRWAGVTSPSSPPLRIAGRRASGDDRRGRVGCRRRLLMGDRRANWGWFPRQIGPGAHHDATLAQHLGDTAGLNGRRRRALRGAGLRWVRAGGQSGLDYRRGGARCRRATPHPHALGRPPAGAVRAIRQHAAAGLRCGRTCQEYGTTRRISGSRRRVAASG
jgi:hypothetical protein